MDERLKNDIQRLAYRRPSKVALSGATAPAPILEKVALGKNSAVTTSAGIASPLTENDYASRTFYTDQSFVSADGVFTFAISPIESISTVDANGNAVVFNYAEPP